MSPFSFKNHFQNQNNRTAQVDCSSGYAERVHSVTLIKEVCASLIYVCRNTASHARALQAGMGLPPPSHGEGDGITMGSTVSHSGMC